MSGKRAPDPALIVLALVVLAYIISATVLWFAAGKPPDPAMTGFIAFLAGALCALRRR